MRTWGLAAQLIERSSMGFHVCAPGLSLSANGEAEISGNEERKVVFQKKNPPELVLMT